MRKLTYAILLVFAVVITGCIDTTEEVTLNEDGSGVLTYTMDMSSLFTMMTQMGGGKEIEKAQNRDTTIFFSKLMDSVKDLSSQEKAVMKNGTMKIKMNVKDEKFFNTLTFPFKKLEELKIIKKALPKAASEAIKRLAGKQMDELPPGMDMEEMSKTKTFDDFFDVNIAPNSLSRVYNKEKYGMAENDQYMKAVQQMSSMGAPMTAHYVFNLPRPVKKAEGKGLKLSSDKKKVTMTVTSDDFFDEPKKFEYRIEY